MNTHYSPDEHDDPIAHAFHVARTASPSEEFARRSRRIILAHRQEPRMKFFFPARFVWAASAGIAVLVTVFATYFASPRAHLAFESEKIAREANQIEFSVKIDEAKYFEESAQVVSVALERIAASDHE